MKLAVFLLSLLFSASVAAQPGRFDNVQIKTVKVAGNVYMLEGEGGNIGVSAGEDGVFLIDGQFGPLTGRILTAIKAITDAVTIHFNADEVTAFHAPHAHTDGDSIVHFRGANVVHMGDIYFAGIYPFIDYGTGGSIRGFIAAIDRVLKIADDNTKIIPGHGPLSNQRELRAYRNMLAKVSAKIERMVKAKKTLSRS